MWQPSKLGQSRDYESTIACYACCVGKAGSFKLSGKSFENQNNKDNNTKGMPAIAT